jgi:hypothetical protein
MPVKIEVHGLRELGVHLGSFDRKLPKVVDQACKEAAQAVADGAKRRMPFGPEPGGHVRASTRTARIRGGYEARAGGARYPYYMWLEYGGHVGRRHHTYRTRSTKGRYMYPALVAASPKIRRILNRALARAARQSGLHYHGGA